MIEPVLWDKRVMLPFKQSGIGRDQSLHAMEKYTELKTTWVRLN